MRRLVAHRWPGNVRELEMLVGRLAQTRAGETIDVRDLPNFTPAPTPQHRPALTLREQEQVHILGILDECEGNKLQAAKVLGISRATLYKKLRQYGAVD